MNTNSKVPVIILNGFLGSGKTTMFRNILAQSKSKHIAVGGIVNDMSELDVDGQFLGKSAAVEEDNKVLVSIHSCVLSSEKGLKQLDQAIQQLLVSQDPELIVIETSGSCHPLPLVEYFKQQSKVKLTGVFALVDSLMLSHDFNDGASLVPRLQENLNAGKRDMVNLLVEQIMFCSHLLLTKGDRIEKSKLPRIASFIQEINPYAAVHSVFFGKLEIESLFKLRAYDYFKVALLIEELKPVLASEAEADRPYDLATRVIKDDRPFHPQRLWNVCHQHLGQGIHRSKGFFWLASRDRHAMLWNQAAGGISLEIIGTWRSGVVDDADHGISEMEIAMLREMLAKESGRFGDRHCNLTVIGDKSQVDRFTDALKSCFLSDREIALWNNGHVFTDPWPQNLLIPE